jgi:hypothetical protein
VYTQAKVKAKREAQQRIVEMIASDEGFINASSKHERSQPGKFLNDGSTKWVVVPRVA